MKKSHSGSLVSLEVLHGWVLPRRNILESFPELHQVFAYSPQIPTKELMRALKFCINVQTRPKISDPDLWILRTAASETVVGLGKFVQTRLVSVFSRASYRFVV